MLPALPAYLGACRASEAPAWTPRPSTRFNSKACYLLCRDKVRLAEFPEDLPNTERLSVHSQNGTEYSGHHESGRLTW